MQLYTLKYREIAGRGWRGVLIVIAICSLTLSVATRFWASSTSQSKIVKSVDQRSVEPKRQHLNKDATRWVAPLVDFSIFVPAAIETSLALSGPVLPKHVFSESLYNRPPPSSVFFL
jgi:hypothetical protein